MSNVSTLIAAATPAAPDFLAGILTPESVDRLRTARAAAADSVAVAAAAIASANVSRADLTAELAESRQVKADAAMIVGLCSDAVASLTMDARRAVAAVKVADGRTARAAASYAAACKRATVADARVSVAHARVAVAEATAEIAHTRAALSGEAATIAAARDSRAAAEGMLKALKLAAIGK